MQIQLSEWMQIPNLKKHMEVPIDADTFSLQGISYSITRKSPVDLELENLGEKKMRIRAQGKITLLIPCSRCLEPVSVDFPVEVEEEFDFSRTEQERNEELDEQNYLNGYDLDVDRLFFDEISLDFPGQVLCREDCKGICATCGTNLNEHICSCDQTVRDPRMAAIQQIFKENKEV